MRRGRRGSRVRGWGGSGGGGGAGAGTGACGGLRRNVDAVVGDDEVCGAREGFSAALQHLQVLRLCDALLVDEVFCAHQKGRLGCAHIRMLGKTRTHGRSRSGLR